ncbi:hypothetical protein BDW59DRAFT_167236 [Aspergillus cavernicola]|uniref:N-acetyltransferase domain-containing protein n=1 Tax=Aspergillus cavernicola TaxID=176166 RepID=A0ABR4HFV7_9EURO
MPSDHQITDKIISIPKYLPPDALKLIVTRYKILRLTGLEIDPDAFTSTYARERQFSDENWTARAMNPGIFVALFPDLRVPTGIQFDGQVVFPACEENARSAPWELFKDIDFQDAAKVDIPVGSRVVYVLVGMYVLPEGRGAGDGRRLVEAAIGAVDREMREKGVNATVVVLVARDNLAAKSLYEQVGFIARGETVDIRGDQNWALSLEIGE